MRLERIYTTGLAQIAYLVGDDEAGVAAVIDPRRDIQDYLDLAASAGLRITHVFETHVHADFVSGARELAEATGATIYASRLGQSEFPHQPLDDGDVVNVGALRLTALWTPGHTPEHLSYLLTDPAVSDAPQALFSGDMLFVGEVGRPDLLGEAQTNQLVDQLYDSIFERLVPLNDDIVVYPGHGAGSACGKKIGDQPSTTIGQEKRFNYAFRERDRDAFRRVILEGMPPAPTYYPVLKRINKVGPVLLRELPDGEALAAEVVSHRMEQEALVVDARTPDAFGVGHVSGAVFAGLGPNFTAWMGWLAPYEQDVILVLEHDDDYAEARTELHRIGLDRIAGYLAGGMDAWRTDGRLTQTVPQMSVEELRGERSVSDLAVLDVRSPDEWQGGHIPGASYRYVADIIRGADGVPAEGPLAVVCGSGYRSSVVVSVLQREGYDNLINVIGGMGAWQDAGFETTTT